MVVRSSGLKENMPRYLHSVAGLGPVLDSGPGGEGQRRGKGRGTEMGGAHDRIKPTFALAIFGGIHYHSHLSHVSMCACELEL